MFHIKCVKPHAVMENKYLFVLNRCDQIKPEVYETVLKLHQDFIDKHGFTPFFSHVPSDYLMMYQFVPVNMQKPGKYFACNLCFRKVEKNNRTYVNVGFDNINECEQPPLPNGSTPQSKSSTITWAK